MDRCGGKCLNLHVNTRGGVGFLVEAAVSEGVCLRFISY